MAYKKHYKYLVWVPMDEDGNGILASQSVFERSSEITEGEKAELIRIKCSDYTEKKLDTEVKRYMRSIGFKVKKITNMINI